MELTPQAFADPKEPAPRVALRATFWGVRGSYPVPGPSTVKFGGNTSCLEVDALGHKIVIDAGTGIIGLGQKLLRDYFKRMAGGDANPNVITLLLSHTHHDHTQGFPYFSPAYMGASVIYTFGPRSFHEDIHDTMTKAMLAPYHPVDLEELSSLRTFHHVSESEVVFFSKDAKKDAQPRIMNRFRQKDHAFDVGVAIRNIKSYAHPKTGVYVYRIEAGGRSLVYATDTEGYIGGDQRIVQFAKGADLLIHDAQYTDEEYVDKGMPKQGWGHSTWRMAAEVAASAGVGKLVLFHHDPVHDDAAMEKIEADCRALFPESRVAREGDAIELPEVAA